MKCYRVIGERNQGTRAKQSIPWVIPTDRAEEPVTGFFRPGKK